MQYPTFADPGERVVEAYDAFAVPSVFVIDVKGVVRAVSVGYSSVRLSKMEKLLEKLLEES
jgi:alkyl hydroperoxide reductase subunit AhpC